MPTIQVSLPLMKQYIATHYLLFLLIGLLCVCVCVYITTECGLNQRPLFSLPSVTTKRTKGTKPYVSSDTRVTGGEIRLFELAALFSLSLTILVISKQLLCNVRMLDKATSSPLLEIPMLQLRPHPHYCVFV